MKGSACRTRPLRLACQRNYRASELARTDVRLCRGARISVRAPSRQTWNLIAGCIFVSMMKLGRWPAGTCQVTQPRTQSLS